MNAMNMAKMAYATTQAPIRTSRGVEYEAFALVTRDLKTASLEGRENFARLAEALHKNRQLWTILAADVAEEDNQLPKALRAQIFYLAEFVAQHSRKVLKNEETADVLVEINTTMMRGLRGQDAAA